MLKHTCFDTIAHDASIETILSAEIKKSKDQLKNLIKQILEIHELIQNTLKISDQGSHQSPQKDDHRFWTMKNYLENPDKYSDYGPRFIKDPGIRHPVAVALQSEAGITVLTALLGGGLLIQFIIGILLLTTTLHGSALFFILAGTICAFISLYIYVIIVSKPKPESEIWIDHLDSAMAKCNVLAYRVERYTKLNKIYSNVIEQIKNDASLVDAFEQYLKIALTEYGFQSMRGKLLIIRKSTMDTCKDTYYVCHTSSNDNKNTPLYEAEINLKVKIFKHQFPKRTDKPDVLQTLFESSLPPENIIHYLKRFQDIEQSSGLSSCFLPSKSTRLQALLEEIKSKEPMIELTRLKNRQ